jgi:gas vesicle protein
MTETNGLSAKTGVLLFLSGAVIGAGAALLLAPESGRQSQARLRGYAQRAQGKLHEFEEQASDAFSQSVEKGKDVIQATKSALSEALSATGDRLREERERLSGSKKA